MVVGGHSLVPDAFLLEAGKSKRFPVAPSLPKGTGEGPLPLCIAAVGDPRGDPATRTGARRGLLTGGFLASGGFACDISIVREADPALRTRRPAVSAPMEEGGHELDSGPLRRADRGRDPRDAGLAGTQVLHPEACRTRHQAAVARLLQPLQLMHES